MLNSHARTEDLWKSSLDGHQQSNHTSLLAIHQLSLIGVMRRLESLPAAWRPLHGALVTTSRNFSCLFCLLCICQQARGITLGICCMLLLSSVKCGGVLYWAKTLVVADPFAKSCWTGAVEVIQGSFPLAQWACWCLHLPFGVVGWMD